MLVKPKEFLFNRIFRDLECSCNSPHGHAFAKKLKDQGIEVWFFLIISRTKTSRGKGFAAGFALETADPLMVSGDAEETFFDKASPMKCVVEARGIGAGLW
jgi:hypothetical protein